MSNKYASLAAIAFAATLVLLTPSAARAQKAGPVMGMRPAPAPASVAPARTSFAAAPAAAHRMPSSGVRVNAKHGVSRPVAGNSANNGHRAADGFGVGGGFPLSVQDLLNLTPTNGFNYQYLNSINQDLPIKAFIDPVTQIEVAQAERLLRRTGGAFSGAYIIGGGGYYAPPEYDENAQAAEPPQGSEQQPAQNSQPQVIVLQQGPAQQPAQAAPSEPSESPEEQVPDRGEFTLVLRNGQQLDAVAFTRANDHFVYITPDGSRRTVAAGDLDSDATVRVNQERGTPLQLPL